jgi:hypothetical protein
MNHIYLKLSQNIKQAIKYQNIVLYFIKIFSISRLIKLGIICINKIFIFILKYLSINIKLLSYF